MLVCLGGWYLYREKLKTAKERDDARAENKELINDVINSQEDRIKAEYEHRALLKTLIEKNGETTAAMTRAFERMEANQLKLMEEIREFKSRH